MTKKLYSVLFSLFIFILVFFLYITGKPTNSAGFFKVESGQSLSQIGKNLTVQKFLNSRYPFYFYVLISGKSGSLKTGSYMISQEDNFFDIANKIVKGDTYRTKVTFPEGFNLNDVEKRLNESGLALENISLSKFKLGDFKDKFVFLEDAPDTASLEGYLFPDTYYFEADKTEKEIVEVFLDNFDKKLTSEMKEEIKKQNNKIFDIVIMASLIEKEVKTLEDKKLVSGVFWKRIKLGIPLQSCATIAYALGIDKWIYSFEDTRVDSPYNTYLNRGLPTGPISNPGLESIQATIYPEKSDYLYYLSTLEGETIFSKTLEEHNINKAKYLK